MSISKARVTIVILCLMVFRLATQIGAALGTIGNILQSRLQGALLAALAV